MGKRELVALLRLSSWRLMIVVLLFLAVPQVCLQFVIVVFPSQTHLLYYAYICLFLRAHYRYVCVNQIMLWRLVLQMTKRKGGFR